MRGYASIGVVVFHLLTISPALRDLGLPALISAWNSGVDFFFVLSGFLLSLPFMGGAALSLKVYYVKRIFRILPVYYVSLAICGASLLLLNLATVQQLLTSLVFAQSLSPSTFNSINGVNWTLVIEEIFYASLPLFSKLFTGRRWMSSLPACIALSLAYRLYVVSTFPADDLAFRLWQYPSFLGHFAFGLSLASLYSSGKVRPGAVSSLPALAAIALLLATQSVVGSLYSVGNNLEVFPSIAFSFEYAALILAVLASPTTSPWRSAFTNRVVVSAGKISYSMYTWHLPIEVGLFQVGLPALVWAPLSLAAATIAATWSFRNLEAPSLRLRDRLLQGRPIEARAAPVRAGL